MIAYSGDTEWTESLVDAARGVDLFICEAYFFEKKIKYHLDYRTLREQRERLACGRLMLTHMSQDMLNRLDEVEFECANRPYNPSGGLRESEPSWTNPLWSDAGEIKACRARVRP